MIILDGFVLDGIVLVGLNVFSTNGVITDVCAVTLNGTVLRCNLV